MVIFLTGENDFEIKRTLDAIVLKFVQKFGANGVERVAGEDTEPAALSQLLQGASLFAQQRLVVLRDAADNKQLWDALGDWVERVPAETTLIIVEPKPDKRSRTFKSLTKHADVRECKALSERELTSWVVNCAKKLGGSIAPSQANYLVMQVGTDQWRLQHEIEKLVSYDPTVTKESIDELVETSSEGNVFALLDAALSGNLPRTEELLNQLKTNEDPYKFFGLLSSQVHTLALVAHAGTRTPDEIAKASGTHPFVVRKAKPIVQRLGTQKLRSIVHDVAQCDTQLKTTGQDPWRLIELALGKLAT
ncbi:MAG: DNA polymerase III subunit delta [Candidatus Saccharimonadales bacterium]